MPLFAHRATYTSSHRCGAGDDAAIAPCRWRCPIPRGEGGSGSANCKAIVTCRGSRRSQPLPGARLSVASRKEFFALRRMPGNSHVRCKGEVFG